MVNNVSGSSEAAAAVPPAQSGTPTATQCMEGCPCQLFIRYNDPFMADYGITNCAGLSARLRNIWGDLDPGTNGTFLGQGNREVTVTFSVRGLQRDASAAGALINRGEDYASDAPDSACDILFVLWPLTANRWGVQFVDSNGALVLQEAPIRSSDFHIVAGRIDKDGKMPNTVYSTNGGRPLEGPAPIAHWTFTEDVPYMTTPDNNPVFARTDSFRNLPATLVPFQTADMPANAVDDDTGQPVVNGAEYFRLELYNNRPTTEAFIVKADFMRSFSSSA